MAETSAELFEQGRSDAFDLANKAEELMDHLRNAGSCETIKDFAANVAKALDTFESLTSELNDLRALTLNTTRALGREKHNAK